jgi:hypothetical protein
MINKCSRYATERWQKFMSLLEIHDSSVWAVEDMAALDLASKSEMYLTRLYYFSFDFYSLLPIPQADDKVLL